MKENLLCEDWDNERAQSRRRAAAATIETMQRGEQRGLADGTVATTLIAGRMTSGKLDGLTCQLASFGTRIGGSKSCLVSLCSFFFITKIGSHHTTSHIVHHTQYTPPQITTQCTSHTLHSTQRTPPSKQHTAHGHVELRLPTRFLHCIFGRQCCELRTSRIQRRE